MVFPLYGSETGETSNHALSEGLNYYDENATILLAKASAVMKERAGTYQAWGSQSYWGLEKKRTMSSLIICHSARALFGIT